MNAETFGLLEFFFFSSFIPWSSVIWLACGFEEAQHGLLRAFVMAMPTKV
jgi:hypothetical protein